jgi:hypothetical protein
MSHSPPRVLVQAGEVRAYHGHVLQSNGHIRESLRCFWTEIGMGCVHVQRGSEMRTAVGAKVLSINLLLATHTSESISRVEAQARVSHASLLASILELRSQAVETDVSLRITQKTISRVAKEQARHEKILEDNAGILRNVSDAATATNTMVMSFRDLGVQLLQLVSTLPQQVRESLDQVVRSNQEIYTLVRDVHSSLLRSPVHDPLDTFRFVDVLGRSKTLPYQYFRHESVFRAFLEIEFRGLPGEKQVLDMQYLIMDVKRRHKPVPFDKWEQGVFPGAVLAMSVWVELLMKGMCGNLCPRPGCDGKGRPHPGRLLMTW